MDDQVSVESTNGRGKPRAQERLHELAQMRHDPEAIRQAFETGEYPYKTKIRRSGEVAPIGF